MVCKYSALLWRKTNFVNRSDCWRSKLINVTTAFAIINCLEHELWKNFCPKMTAVILKILHPFKYPRVMSSELMKNSFTDCPPCLLAEMAKAPKCHKAGTHEGACSWNTLPKHAPESDYPNQYTRRTRRGSWWWNNPIEVRNELWMKNISQFDWPTGDTSCRGKQIPVHTRELAPETDSCNSFAPGACSLLSNQFDMREQNSGAKFCCAT